jgi:hypothetical protein
MDIYFRAPVRMKHVMGCIFAFAAACAPAARTTAGDGREALEAAVYAVVIDSLLASPRVPFVVIADSTWQAFGTDLFGDSTAAIYRDFLAINRERRSIPARLPARTGVRRLRYSTHARGDRFAAFQRFRREYAPALGFYILSRPGFSADRHQAMLTILIGCEAHCTQVELVTLAWRGGRWRITEHQVVVEM